MYGPAVSTATLTTPGKQPSQMDAHAPLEMTVLDHPSASREIADLHAQALMTDKDAQTIVMLIHLLRLVSAPDLVGEHGHVTKERCLITLLIITLIAIRAQETEKSVILMWLLLSRKTDNAQEEAAALLKLFQVPANATAMTMMSLQKNNVTTLSQAERTLLMEYALMTDPEQLTQTLTA